MALKFGWKVWVLIIAIILSIISINPFLALKKGVLVVDVVKNSTAEKAGMSVREVIKEINGIKINNIEDWSKAVDKIFNGSEVRVEIKTDKSEYIFLASKPEFSVKGLPSSRLKLGLDLQGGSRALVRPEENVDEQTLSNMQQILMNRFNAYGIYDVKISQTKDLQGNAYLFIEMAGATPKELEDLITSQGKFEAKIGNNTIFVGGGKDITSVCQSSKCSGVLSCDKISEGYVCRFSFAVYLSKEAAERQAKITSALIANASMPQYLNETLDLYLDDNLVDSLLISIDLKGKPTTEVAISGPGYGKTREEAYEEAIKNMKKLQTILITGSLPIKLKIEKLDSISPLLGKEILRNILITALIVIVAVSLFIFIRYRKLSYSIPIILTMLSEIFIIIGIAAFISWNLDLASIAGIIAAIGTGVDDQIVILDETETTKKLSVKERIKRAFFIIFGAYATTVAAMLPLWQAGAGLLKGFALTTIIGISVGVFITRPAFGEIISRLKKHEE